MTGGCPASTAGGAAPNSNAATARIACFKFALPRSLLLTREIRRALAAKRLHAFGKVLRAPQLGLAVRLDLQLLVERAGQFPIEHRLDALEGLGGTGSEPPCDRFRLELQRRVVDTGPDEPPVRRVRSAQGVAEQRQALGARRSHPARQMEGAAEIRHQ